VPRLAVMVMRVDRDSEFWPARGGCLPSAQLHFGHRAMAGSPDVHCGLLMGQNGHSDATMIDAYGGCMEAQVRRPLDSLETNLPGALHETGRSWKSALGRQ
jgi:hypothetical protein